MDSSQEAMSAVKVKSCLFQEPPRYTFLLFLEPGAWFLNVTVFYLFVVFMLIPYTIERVMLCNKVPDIRDVVFQSRQRESRRIPFFEGHAA